MVISELINRRMFYKYINFVYFVNMHISYILIRNIIKEKDNILYSNICSMLSSLKFGILKFDNNFTSYINEK